MSASLRAVPAANPQQMLTSVWQRNLPLVRKRLASLKLAAQDAADGRLLPPVRAEAAEISHKLAGSLGMFGYSRGTEVAQQLEILLEADGPVPGTVFSALVLQLEQALQL